MPKHYDTIHPEPEREGGYQPEPNGGGMSYSPFERRLSVMHQEMVDLLPAFRAALADASKTSDVLAAHEASDGFNAAIQLRDALARALRSEPLRAAVDGAIARDLDRHWPAPTEAGEDIGHDTADMDHDNSDAGRAA